MLNINFGDAKRIFSNAEKRHNNRAGRAYLRRLQVF